MKKIIYFSLAIVAAAFIGVQIANARDTVNKNASKNIKLRLLVNGKSVTPPSSVLYKPVFDAEGRLIQINVTAPGKLVALRPAANKTYNAGSIPSGGEMTVSLKDFAPADNGWCKNAKCIWFGKEVGHTGIFIGDVCIFPCSS